MRIARLTLRRRLGEKWKDAAMRHSELGTPFRWRDRFKRVHAVELWPLEPGSSETTGNTLCGMFDVPPGEGWTGDDLLTCTACARKEDSKQFDDLRRAIRIMRRA
jgi:hypothetical protein